MRLSFGTLHRDSSGSAATEFAFTAPLLIMVIVAIMEFSMILFLTTLLEGSLRDAARFAVTGTTPIGMTREEAIVQKLQDATMGLVSIEQENVSTLIYPAFSNVGQPEPYIDDSPSNGQYDTGESYTDINGDGEWSADMGKPGVGGECDVVVYRVESDWPLMFGLLAASIGQQFTISASTAVRNEPYGNNAC